MKVEGSRVSFVNHRGKRTTRTDAHLRASRVCSHFGRYRWDSALSLSLFHSAAANWEPLSFREPRSCRLVQQPWKRLSLPKPPRLIISDTLRLLSASLPRFEIMLGDPRVYLITEDLPSQLFAGRNYASSFALLFFFQFEKKDTVPRRGGCKTRSKKKPLCLRNPHVHINDSALSTPLCSCGGGFKS